MALEDTKQISASHMGALNSHDAAEASDDKGFDIPEDGSKDKNINYKGIYEKLLEKYNQSMAVSNTLYSHEQGLRNILHEAYRRNNAVMDILIELEDYDSLNKQTAASGEEIEKKDTGSSSKGKNLSHKDLKEYFPGSDASTAVSDANKKQIQEILAKKPHLEPVLKILLLDEGHFAAKNNNDNKPLDNVTSRHDLDEGDLTAASAEKLFQIYNSIPALARDAKGADADVEANPSNTSSWLRFNYPRIFNDTGDILNTLRPLPNTSAYILLNSLILLPHTAGTGEIAFNGAAGSESATSAVNAVETTAKSSAGTPFQGAPLSALLSSTEPDTGVPTGKAKELKPRATVRKLADLLLPMDSDDLTNGGDGNKRPKF